MLLKYFPSSVFTRVPAGIATTTLLGSSRLNRTEAVARSGAFLVSPTSAASASKALPVLVFSISILPFASAYCMV